jgi:hypothetical protein
MIFNSNNWYWIVAGSTTQVYSSSTGDYILVSNPTYQSWLSTGNKPTNIDSEANLGDVIATLGAPKPVNANVLAAWQNSLANNVNQAIFKVLFNHENRIRTLEGKSTITVQQAIAGFAALM